MSDNNDLLASYKLMTLLEEACENTEKILDGMPSVFVILNSKNQVIRANQAFCDLLGVSMENCLHLEIKTIFSLENQNILLHQIQRFRNNPQPGAKLQFNLDLIAPSCPGAERQYHWLLFRIEAKNAAEGDIICLIGDDLSDTYQSEMKLLSIFSSLPIGLLILDSSGCVSEVLSEYCHVLFGRQNLIGQTIHQLLDDRNTESENFNQGLDRLIDSIGKPKAEFNKLDSMLPKLISVKPQAQPGDERWIKIGYQPILKSDVIHRYMLILEDETATMIAQKEKERVEILEKQTLALYECAIRDPLSGLYTRLFMKDSVKSLLNSFSRNNIEELSLALFDIDHFKSINDTYGHSVGDEVIKKIGGIILKNSRDSDIAVRYGGEEFLAILPSKATDHQSGSIYAERVRKSIEDCEIVLDSGKILKVTISCGVAYCKKGEQIGQLIERADHYLYRAKKTGRNKVCSENDTTD